MTDDRDAFEPTEDLTELRALEVALGELETEARVPEGLWAGIRARMDGPGSAVVDLEAWRATGPKRFTLSLGQLVAAGIALVFLSSGGMWLALSGGSGATGSATVPVLGAPGGALAVSNQGSVPQSTLQDYQNAVVELEMILEEGRQVLGHETIQTIEESLTIVDDAIADAQRALARDPGSEMLNRSLARSMWKKMQILRQTAVVIRARST